LLRVYKLHLGSPEFTRFSGLMDTYMDTTGFIWFPERQSGYWWSTVHRLSWDAGAGRAWGI